MKFQPKILHPDPDPFYQRELKRLDPDLRLVWGFDRYLMKKWVVERRIQPSRYFAMYASLFEMDGPRFVEQPIYDDDQPIFSEDGIQIDTTQVGVRQYDLAPEWEWLYTAQNKDQSYKPFGMDDMLELRRMYAWNYTHPISRRQWEAAEKAKEDAAKAALIEHRRDLFADGYDQARREAGVKVQTTVPSGVGD